jgi:hypothetical protein
VPFEGGSCHGLLARPEAHHEIFWAMLARHEHEGHAVPRISARRATRLGPHFGPCLGRHGTEMTRKHFYNYTMQFSNICYTISHLIHKCIMKIIKTFIKIVHMVYIFHITGEKNSKGYFEGHAWTGTIQGRVGVPRAVLRPKKRFIVPYWHGPMCLPCLKGTTQSSTKHERAMPCRHGTAKSQL